MGSETEWRWQRKEWVNLEEGPIEIIYFEIQREKKGKWIELQEPLRQYQKVTGVQTRQEKDIRAEKYI